MGLIVNDVSTLARFNFAIQAVFSQYSRNWLSLIFFLTGYSLLCLSSRTTRHGHGGHPATVYSKQQEINFTDCLLPAPRSARVLFGNGLCISSLLRAGRAEMLTKDLRSENIIPSWNTIASPQTRKSVMCRCQNSDKNEKETLRSLRVDGVLTGAAPGACRASFAKTHAE